MSDKSDDHTHNPYHDQKLLWSYHRKRALAILRGEIPPPSLVEIDPTDEGCNQSCVFCCFHSSTHRKIKAIDVEMLLRFVAEAYNEGTYAYELVGGGEPTNHPRIADIIRRIAALAKPGHERPHIGMVTNGVLLHRIHEVSDNLDFIRIGLDAPNEPVYSALHGIPASLSHFSKMIDNATKLIDKIGGGRIRFGYLVFPPFNHHQEMIIEAVEIAHNLGAEHIAFRPAYGTLGATIEMWKEVAETIIYLKGLYRKGFILGGTGGSWPHVLGTQQHPEGVCRTRPLVLVVKADGTIPSCFLYRERLQERPAIGHISQGFAAVWYSDTHRASIQSVNRKDCPSVCKLYRAEHTLEAISDGENRGMDTELDASELDNPHFI